MIKILISKIIVLSSIIAAYCNEEIDLSFPSEFLIGTATSAYQVEGAWKAKGKGESIWDYYVHKYPSRISNKATGDVAVDFYHKYPEDIKLLKDIGFNHFRFSISWSRIFPNGFAVNASGNGIRYYHSILDELEKHGIIPFVTIYHWDHPQVLEKLGGWLNEEMAFIYAAYAKFIFKEFGNRVKFFTTLNEPNVFCRRGYGATDLAPGANLTEYGEYLCVQNMLKAHALAYHTYDKYFRKEQNGIIGLVTACNYCFPKNENDTTSANIAFDFECGWVSHPIFSKTGDYPHIMKKRIKERSIAQGYRKSRFPILTRPWVEYIRGSADYFGLNYYTSCVTEPLPSIPKVDWPSDSGLKQTFNASWPSSDIYWLKVVPKGLGRVLRKIKNTYDNPPVFILENGVVDNKRINDSLRINYLYSHMKEVLTAIKRDECDVQAYTIWSFLDSFEWNTGYTPRFGLVDVEYKDKNRKRSYKRSTRWMKSLLKSRKLQLSYENSAH